MKAEIRTPCQSCPYRKDARLAFWDRAEFGSLLRADADPMRGAIFQCHEGGKKPQAERDFCAGWLLDQKRRGAPSIQLRLKLMSDPKAAACFEEASDGGHELYESIEEMVAANYGEDL